MNPVWHRYVDFVSEFGAGIRHIEFIVEKTTPKGLWLVPVTELGKRRFILTNARKKFAHPTESEAIESFIARKSRKIDILRARVEHTQKARRIAELMRSELSNQ